MPILCSVVACDRHIVANFASCDGNFMEIVERVLTKLPPCNNKMTYSHGIYLLHYIAEEQYLYFCITDKLCQRSRAFLFLNEIRRRFMASKQSKENMTTVLAAEMYRYSEDYSTITIQKGELDELNSIGVGCSESLLGEKILYINNPDNISYSTVSHVDASPARISVSVLPVPVKPSALDRITVVSPTQEGISVVSPTQEGTPENISIPKTEDISVAGLNKEKSVVNSKLYVVIIGMIILIIGMAVYAFGPITCVVITSIGIYSMLRFYVDSNYKSD